MTKELTLTTQDLSSVGINTELTSNDLVEVVAQEIFDKFYDKVDSIIEKGKLLLKKKSEIMNKELEKMKQDLIDGGYIEKEEHCSTEYSSLKNEYWSSDIEIASLYLEDVNAGTKVKLNSRSYSVPSPKHTKLKISLTARDSSKEQDISINGITGYVETNISKSFQKQVSIPHKRFDDFKKEVEGYNKEVMDIYNYLPKNKILSIERFTREARVKMNKKIISSQSPDFKQKMAELFSIKFN